MRAISNAMLSQAEIEQTDHWERGPLELVSFDVEAYRASRVEWVGLVASWNREYEGGLCRDGDCLENLQQFLPGPLQSQNPNLFLAPRANGFSQLEVMLGSVVPTSILRKYGIDKQRANLWLLPFHEDLPPGYGEACCTAFEAYVWSKLVHSSRSRYDFFSTNSPFRLLAGDSQYWMSRLYRVALARYETFAPTTHIDEHWRTIEEIEQNLAEQVPDWKEQRLLVRRPRMGGTIWDINDEDECEQVVDEMLDGIGLMEPLDPLLDLLHSHQTHEDFSSQYSWIKEDFERAFYSKRSRVKVVMVETVDHFPAWNAGECFGYEDVIFRDLLSCFDRKSQRILIALRHGKTITEIARESGLKGHASISRRISQIKKQVHRLIG
jgi:hypothetical protein